MLQSLVPRLSSPSTSISSSGYHTDAEGLKEWLQSWKAGLVLPHIKSEPAPEINDGPVFIAVGSTYEDLVTNPLKSVMLMFYAPLCGHCKSLAPKYDALAE